MTRPVLELAPAGIEPVSKHVKDVAASKSRRTD
jgi:hypothetical protein